MILSRRVALNGQQLDDLHERIVIRSVDAGVPHESVNAASIQNIFGQRITDQHWETMEVSVNYAIDVPKKQMALRRQIFEAVNRWATQKGWLTCNWMPDRRMWVDKVVYPSAGDMWDWMNEYTITFRAYGIPFWQGVTPNQVNLYATSGGTWTIDVQGNIPSPTDVDFTNVSGMTIPYFSIRVGYSLLVFNNLGLGGGETLRITHGTSGLLSAKIGSRSVYDKLDPQSTDRLIADPGIMVVQMSATRAGNLSVRNYGGYV